MHFSETGDEKTFVNENSQVFVNYNEIVETMTK